MGGAGLFADYSQWESWQEERKQDAKSDARTAARATAPAESVGQSGKKKLSYLEAREYETIEQRVAGAEAILQAKRVQLENPEIVSDGPRLVAAHAEMEEAQETVDTLYARWAELEKKKN
jgi:ATP-binding cassette subfamily F protein uup